MLPKDFKNFYDRINDLIPPKIVVAVSNGEKEYNISAYQVKVEYTDWVEEVMKLIDGIDGIGKKKKKEIRAIVNASCLEDRQKYGNRII